MKYLLSIVLLLVVGSGCATAGAAANLFAPKSQGGHYQGRGQWQRSPAPGYVFEGERYELGVLIGSTDGWGSEAVDYFYDSEFRSGRLFGVSGTFVFQEWQGGMGFAYGARYGIELRITDYSLGLNESGFDFGDLDVTSVVCSFRFLQEPNPGSVVGFHVDLGLGIASTHFTKSSELENEEIATATTYTIDTTSTLPLVFGVGLDFHIDPEVCLSLEYRYEILQVPVDWSENGVLRPDIDWFNADNHQFMVGIRFLFW